MPIIAQHELTQRLKKWFKSLFIRLYRWSVYCKSCGYEIGTNPECPKCISMGHRK
jgi:predicted Zn-ribbon and HTH transcriptional regulator